MSTYTGNDLMLTPEGDFALDENDNLKLSMKNDLIAQKVFICLQTTNPDWKDGNIGADLEDLLGQPNNVETGKKGQQMIVSALMKTGFFDREDIYVEAQPKDYQSMVFLLFINSPFSEPLSFYVDLDLGNGIRVRRVE